MNLINTLFDKSSDPREWLLNIESVNDWDLFFDEINQPTSEFSAHITESLFSNELREKIKRGENTIDIQKAIVDAINRGMVNNIFFEPKRTPRIELLDDEMRNLVVNSIKRKGWALVKANRIVWDLQFDGFVKPKFSKFEIFRDRLNSLTTHVDRKWKFDTSAFRMIPSFIIAGVQRCGTSSLFYYLCQHPNIVSPEKKELNFFTRPNYSPDLRYYRSFFPLQISKNKRNITGEATPEYSLFPVVMQRIQELIPEIKIILIVRDPVKRAISHFQAQEPHRRPKSFRLAIQLDQELFDIKQNVEIREPGDNEKHWHSYIARGRYIDYIPFIYKYFPKDNILVLRAEDMYADPLSVVNNCFDFLGIKRLSSINNENFTDIKRNQDKTLQSLKITSEKIDEYVLFDLYDYFRTFNQMFYEFIGRDMRWDY